MTCLFPNARKGERCYVNTHILDCHTIHIIQAKFIGYHYLLIKSNMSYLIGLFG